MLGGLSLDGSRITLNPETMLHGLAVKNLEMLHVQPYCIASLAATLSFWSRSSMDVAWMYISSTYLSRCVPRPEYNLSVFALKASPELDKP